MVVHLQIEHHGLLSDFSNLLQFVWTSKTVTSNSYDVQITLPVALSAIYSIYSGAYMNNAGISTSEAAYKHICCSQTGLIQAYSGTSSINAKITLRYILKNQTTFILVLGKAVDE